MKLELNLDWRRTVKTIMTAKNMSTSELAKAVGTTDASIRQVITKSTRGSMLNKVSEVLGITNDEVQHIVIEVD